MEDCKKGIRALDLTEEEHPLPDEEFRERDRLKK